MDAMAACRLDTDPLPSVHHSRPTTRGNGTGVPQMHWGIHTYDFARRAWASAVVDELERDAEVGLLEHRDDRLQVVLLLGRHAQLVALDLGLHALRGLVTDALADRLGLLLVDALDDAALDPVRLARGPGLAGIERLERDPALDQLLLEHVQGRLRALLGLRRDDDELLAAAVDLGA